MITLRIFSFYP